MAPLIGQVQHQRLQPRVMDGCRHPRASLSIGVESSRFGPHRPLYGLSRPTHISNGPGTILFHGSLSSIIGKAEPQAADG
jgi:hypothetical protein